MPRVDGVGPVPAASSDPCGSRKFRGATGQFAVIDGLRASGCKCKELK